jgi:beta-galactosidase/beta-glucuronidase
MVLDESEKIVSGETKTIPGNKFRMEEIIENFKPWNIHNSYLYTFVLKLDINGKQVVKKFKFGMRKFHISEHDVFLNNEKIFIRGVIRGRPAHDHPNLEKLPLYDYYAKYMRMMKIYGFNFIRFHSQIPPRECLLAADDLGILIHVEMRIYYGKYQKERSTMKGGNKLLDRQEWKKMILQLRNYTSLMVYCMGNEINNPGQNPICEEFYQMTHKFPRRI